MLTRIEINNFKSFNDTFVFDLTDTNGFNFNREAIKDNVVKTGIIYGQNGVGKSNLGFAIFDIVAHTTDKRTTPERYENYLNGNSSEEFAKFKFEFKFNNNTLVYKYTKKDSSILLDETIYINGIEYASVVRDGVREDYMLNTKAKGTENLNKNLSQSNISIVKYINSNTILEETLENSCFSQFIKFINEMLFFRNLDDRFYIGYEENTYSIADSIVSNNHLADFNKFLNDAGVKCDLAPTVRGDKNDIDFVFENKTIPLFEIASSGTISLTLLYFWYKKIQAENHCSFLFIDEFDAFYHHRLSSFIVEKLRDLDIQVMLTTHNSSIMSNELLRPDCYFIMDYEKIEPLTRLTDRELREGHNIEKMYRANSFE